MSVLVNGKEYPQLADLEKGLQQMLGGLPQREQVRSLNGEELILFLKALGGLDFPVVKDPQEILALPSGTILFDDTYKTYDIDVDISAIIKKMRNGVVMFVYYTN